MKINKIISLALVLSLILLVGACRKAAVEEPSETADVLKESIQTGECEGLDAANKDRCYAALAYKTKDKAYCEYVVGTNTKQACLAVLGNI